MLPVKPCRGYIASRAVRGSTFPQHVQNLVIRDYATRTRLVYLLSATEYAMPSCYLVLSAVLDELPELDGIIFFSMFMLPRQRSRRYQIYERILSAKCRLHAALENVALEGPRDILGVEDLLDVTFTMPKLPLAGRYEKDEASSAERGRDLFWSYLLANL